MGSQFGNNLGSEMSPYLVGLAKSPIDWYPWGSEAFNQAVERECPIFLSIGYSTCHWCRVMDNESFQSMEVAQFLNDRFVCIKVDREELPSVDSVYLEFAGSLMSSGGGWPLNLFLTPDLKPFFATCYVPPRSNAGLMGLLELAENVDDVWNGEDRDLLITQAEKVVEISEQNETHIGLELPDFSEYEDAIAQFFEEVDPVFGGMRGSPKFPMTYQLSTCINYAKITRDSRALFFVEVTLDKMAEGGLHDHLGGGFSRYAVDAKWHTPHFEKMLGENALLAVTYFDGWRVFAKKSYREIGEGVLGYVQHCLMSDEGAFYTAEGSEEGGEEGMFYTWTQGEILEALGDELGYLALGIYGLSNDNNREVLVRGRDLNELAKSFEMSTEVFKEKESLINRLLFESREKRARPFLDKKVIVSSNGLMIEAFAQAGFLFDNQAYLDIAKGCAHFIWENMRFNGQLYRRYCDGEVKIEASIEDYANFTRALLTLFEYDQGYCYLEWARELLDEAILALKVEDGAFYQTSESLSPLFQRCVFTDGSLPSGNSVQMENLIRIYQMTSDEEYLQYAEDILKVTKERVNMNSPSAGYCVKGLGRFVDRKASVLYIALNDVGNLTLEIKRWLRETYMPHHSVVWLRNETMQALDLGEMIPVNGETTVYVCRHRKCLTPSVGVDEIASLFKSM